MTNWRASADILNTTFFWQLLFQSTSGLENPPGHGFWLKKSKNDIEIALKPTSLS